MAEKELKETTMAKRGRPEYRLNEDDYGTAIRYISGARQRGEVSSSEGWIAWHQAKNAEALQAWCDEYLPREVWRKLCVTLRQARKRNRDYGKKVLHHVDLTYPAWLALSRCAREMGGITLSAAVLELEQAYNRAKDAGLLKPTVQPPLPDQKNAPEETGAFVREVLPIET